MTALRVVLFAVGYPTAIAVIVRFVPVVRERRTRWLAAHHLGVLAIVLGWSTIPRWSAVAVNGTWFVASALWYGVGPRLAVLRGPSTTVVASPPKPSRKDRR